jgi:tRNA (guanine37-N1)-methyltransferase
LRVFVVKISIITVFPQLFSEFLSTSLIKRACEKGLLSFQLVAFSDLCEPKERIDAPTAGPGVGMLLKPEVVERAIEKCEQAWGKGIKIFFSPQGERLDQRLLEHYKEKYIDHGVQGASSPSQGELHLILICSRYEGMDARVEAHYADEIISIGDYVLMGGDLPAQVFLEGFLRLIPGIVGKDESVQDDSFSGPFLDYPQYAQPLEWKGQKIPPVILSGNHGQIEQWRAEQAALKTARERFDWARSQPLTDEQKKLIQKNIPPHYVVLMHADVVVRDGNKVGNTSITSIDLHDISRSGATYGIKNFFVLSELEDQHLIMKTFLSFWQSEEGRDYNQTRYDAVKRLVPVRTLDEIIDIIRKQDGAAPLLVATSAQNADIKTPRIGYDDQKIVWKENRPVLFILGTGQGLSIQFLEKCDYILAPIEGLPKYNHLSVRSAAAIIFDRWLGLRVQ